MSINTSDSHNPWGGPWDSSVKGGQSPDIKDLFRQGKDRFGKFIPGGNKSIILVVIIILGLWLLSGFYRVEPDEQGVALIFGKWFATTQPGLRYNLPWPIGEVRTPKVTRVNRIDIGYRTFNDGARQTQKRDIKDESLMLTGDENIINIDFTVFWVIDDPKKYLFEIREPEVTVKIAAESAMREVIGSTDLQPALTEARQDIENQTRTLLQTILDEYQSGIVITQVQLQQSDPPDPVIDAFNEVQRAKADSERLRNQATAYRNRIIPRAEGEAARLKEESQAYKEEVTKLAQGDASRFLSVLASYRINKEVTARRMYLETMEQIFNGSNKIIIGTDALGQQGVLPYLPLDQIRKNIPSNP